MSTTTDDTNTTTTDETTTEETKAITAWEFEMISGGWRWGFRTFYYRSLITTFIAAIILSRFVSMGMTARILGGLTLVIELLFTWYSNAYATETVSFMLI